MTSTLPVSAALARYASATTADVLPAAVREQAKLVILDELGSAYFGAGRPAGRLAARYVGALGGRPESTVLGTSQRTSAPLAALANGTAGHADEIDGAHVIGGHPGATLVHASMAVAEHARSAGAELVNAVVLGYDVGVRLIAACGGLFGVKDRTHLHADFLHAVGAAVAAGRLLRLDPDRLAHAMALATFQANGLCALFHEQRHISKAFCNGQYASAGVHAALMAQAGLEGCVDVIGERHGLLDAWGVAGGRDAVVAGLGHDYAIMGANFKFVRAGYPIHAAVEAALTLVREHGATPAEITAVAVGMPENAMRVVDDRAMHDICLQDTLAAALLRGGLRLSESPFPQVLTEPGFARLRALITLGVDSDLNAEQPDGRGATVTITVRDGASHTARVDHPRGHSLRGRVDWADLDAKWRDAVGDRAAPWVATAARLDDLDTVEQLAALFEDHGGERP
jgi:2-methylcitrate dehydratase PrpD